MRWLALVLLLPACATAQAPPEPAKKGDRRHVLTHVPVDLAPLFAPPLRQDRFPIRPFFNYANTSHAEGPRKWYIYAWAHGTRPVVCPAKATFKLRWLRKSPKSKQTKIGGVAALTDVQLTLDVTEDIQVFFMHLAVRADLATRAKAAGGTLVLKAGEQIGWIHNPPWNSLDFGVHDRKADAGMMREKDYWWNVRANPLDYFVPEVRAKIVTLYAPLEKQLHAWGTEPYSSLTQSRSNVLVPKTIWGVWFLDSLKQPLRRHRANWSVINLVPRRWLDPKGFARELELHPKLAGLMTENGRGEQAGRPLYAGGPIGHGRLTILTGNDKNGTGHYRARFNDGKREVWLRWAVTPGAAVKGWDDTLRLEGYPTKAALDAADGLANALRFRRKP